MKNREQIRVSGSGEAARPGALQGGRTVGGPGEGPAPRGPRTPLRKAPQKREQRREPSLALEEALGVGSSGGLCREVGEAEGAGAAVVVAWGGPRRQTEGRGWGHINQGPLWLFPLQAGITRDEEPVWT